MDEPLCSPQLHLSAQQNADGEGQGGGDAAYHPQP